MPGDGKENWKKAIGFLGGRKLVPEHFAKVLGVILDTNLTYDEHITKTVSYCMSCLSKTILNA